MEGKLLSLSHGSQGGPPLQGKWCFCTTWPHLVGETPAGVSRGQLGCQSQPTQDAPHSSPTNSKAPQGDSTRTPLQILRQDVNRPATRATGMFQPRPVPRLCPHQNGPRKLCPHLTRPQTQDSLSVTGPKS